MIHDIADKDDKEVRLASLFCTKYCSVELVLKLSVRRAAGLQEISEELSQVYEACLHWGLRRSETACSLAAVSPQKTRQI
jgi:hypothetical protein